MLNSTENFTNNIEKNASIIMENYSIDDTLERVKEFIESKEMFRDFGDGLSELLIRAGYSEADISPNGVCGCKEKTDFLFKKFNDIGFDITKVTIKGWFENKRRPKVEQASRIKMYAICFALSLNLKNTIWFFNHVYFDRCFNCHKIDEAVYYYCIKNGLSYSDAQRMIEKAESMEEHEESENTFLNNGTVATNQIRAKLDSLNTIDELMDFIANNKSGFKRWNTTARLRINEFKDSIIKEESTKDIIGAFKNKRYISESDIKDCGLMIKEIYLRSSGGTKYPYEISSPDNPYNNNKDNTKAIFYEMISNRTISSNDFILEHILSTKKGVKRTNRLPAMIYNNFPSKKTFSDIDNNINDSNSYDSIRKLLLLLKFYDFWCRILLGISDTSDIPDNKLPQIFIDEADELLDECGYEPVFWGNPYDLTLIMASLTDDPIFFLQSYVGEISDDKK